MNITLPVGTWRPEIGKVPREAAFLYNKNVESTSEAFLLPLDQIQIIVNHTLESTGVSFPENGKSSHFRGQRGCLSIQQQWAPVQKNGG